MTNPVNVCRFLPTTGGTTDWTYSSAVTGYQSPTAAAAINAAHYSYRAESSDLTQWEEGIGVYTSGTGVLTRKRVTANSLGTTAKINFSATPQVAIVALAEDWATAGVVRGHLYGLTLSTAGASTTFTVAAGSAADSTGIDFMVLAASINKTTAAWAVGSGNGAFDGTGSAPTATASFYHVHLIKRLDTGVVDVLLSLSATAPTLPSGYDVFRRIGSIKTNGSFQWVAFKQLGDEFLWGDRVVDVNGTATSTASTLTTLTVPIGVQVIAFGYLRGDYASGATSILVTAPDENDQAVGAYVQNVTVTSAVTVAVSLVRLRTNTSAQLRFKSSGTGATQGFATIGWVDARGRD